MTRIPYELGRVHEGDCLELMWGLPDKCIQSVVTSPPYWGLRDYGVDGQVGLEETPEDYIGKMLCIFHQVWRVLRDDGTLWLNMGDCYAGSTMSGGDGTKAFGGTRPDKVQRLTKLKHDNARNCPGLKPKDLVGMPWRLAFTLQADGWYLRADIIWAKPNPMPESVRDRPTKAHEYLFLMAKSARYYYDQEAIREEAVYEGDKRHLRTDKSKDTGGPREDNGSRMRTGNATSGRNRRSVWEIPTQPFPGAHFATFPQKLVEPCILAGTKPSDVVLDPFAGSGTVGVVAYRHGREFLGFELNPEYCDMANPRVQAARKGITLVEENAGQEVLFP